ncbi:MAG: hypothetical protein GX800_06185, partial [Clostridiaceae bacterium]|nr:hypothetical protein [Clostridiaceae bacterium]
MNIANVVIESRSPAIDKVFHYLIPDDLKLLVGQRVLVPFGRGNKVATGIIVGFTDTSEIDKLKEVIRQISERPVLSQPLIKLAKWMKKKYLCTFYTALKTVMPPGTAVRKTEWVTLINQQQVKAASQKAVIEMLNNTGGTADFGLLSDIPQARQAIGALAAKGIVKVEQDISQQVSQKAIRMVRLTPDFDMPDLPKQATRQAKMLEILNQIDTISVSDLVAFSGGSYATVNA